MPANVSVRETEPGREPEKTCTSFFKNTYMFSEKDVGVFKKPFKSNNHKKENRI